MLLAEDTLWLSISIKDTVYRAAKVHDQEYFINDGGGLYLVVGKNGTKIWKFIFSFERKRKKLSFGVYPDTSLENVRRKAEDARNSLANGIDPSQIRKQARAEITKAAENQNRVNAGLPIVNSFEDIARQWMDSASHTVRDVTNQKKIRRFELYVFPEIGQTPIRDYASNDPCRSVTRPGLASVA
ncbi:tyrosine-type recombinase/integrase [Methylomonas rosea]|uniref:Arm DNA-binding domain-containing protein n=1 Tax=Methylomonas rosea TaxID=2952227 RepID=A0ABT1TQQ6_9GAMM|nr:Arm DNA-binding domain-containing protein [Methylomonas sp. WSC-7]MCQ8117103.1 Arm DNA-binding domain-containing protein [Methylomonas sp. WSC-7]